MDLEKARKMLENSTLNLELAQKKLERANKFLAFSYFLLVIAGINFAVAIYGMVYHINAISLYSLPISALVIILSLYSRYKTDKIFKK